MLPFAFEPGMGYERYADYALDVPMYFVKRGDRYIDVAGRSFRDLMAGRARPSCRASAPPSPTGRTTSRRSFRRCGSSAIWRCAAPTAGRGGCCRRCRPIWVGLLYDDASLDAAYELVKPWNAEERQRLRDDVPRLGFKATIRGRDVLSLAEETLALVRAGLKKRNRLDPYGADETRYLAPLDDFVERGRTQAEELLAKFHGPWGGSVDPVFKEYAY